MKSILCTICARGGSRGVRNKNLASINNKPMLVYSIEQARQSGIFEKIVLSTDSEEIARVGEEAGAWVFFRRSPELATDEAPKLPAIRDALIKSEDFFGCEFKILIDLDASAPLRKPEHIRAALDQFLRDKNDLLLTGVPARRNPYFNMLEIKKGRVCRVKNFEDEHGSGQGIFTRQGAPVVYDMNASIYIFRREILLKHDSLFGDFSTGLFVMDEETAFDVDSELDLKIVRFLVGQK